MNTIYIIDLIGTLMFAISGTMSANRKDIDIFGAAFLGFVTAIGGGSMRDVFLNLRPVWVDDSNYLFAILIGVTLAIIFNKKMDNYARTWSLFDALGISFFTVVGVQKSLLYESSEVAAVMFGVFSASLGGVIRDTLMNEKPLIFRREIYATACMTGAIIYIIMQNMGINMLLSSMVSAGTVFAIRMIAIKKKLYLPTLG